MEKKHFFAFVIVLLLVATFLFIRENYLQAENARVLAKITQEQTEIMRHFGEQTANAKNEVDIADDEVPLGAPVSVSDPAYQAIFTEISNRMISLTPTLVEDFTAESPRLADNPEAVMRLCIQKMNRLSEISAEGISKMSAIHIKTDAENEEAYQGWVHKLTIIYEQQMKRIAAAYMQTVK